MSGKGKLLPEFTGFVAQFSLPSFNFLSFGPKALVLIEPLVVDRPGMRTFKVLVKVVNERP